MNVTMASLVWLGVNWLWPVVLLTGMLTMVIWWGYLAWRSGGRWRWLCLGLKALAILALALCLLEPIWNGARAKPGANLFVILVDKSRSLQIKDQGETLDRAGQIKNTLDTRRQTWPQQLADHFEVRRCTFDSRLQSVANFDALTFDGEGSAILHALTALAERTRNHPVAGILLLTDGNATDLGTLPLPGPSLPPIYPVCFGGKGPERDLAIQALRASQTLFEDAPVSLQAEVLSLGYADRPVAAQLLDAAGKKVDEQILPAPRNGEPAAFHFRVKPEPQRGVVAYRVRVGAKDEWGQFEGAQPTREATLENNQRTVTVHRGNGPYRILYVSGRPNWEYKFLHRAVESDEQLQLVALIRVAKREPKFDFRGRAGETSNPLFRGFGSQSREETERYDQPVLSRLNTRDELELRAGFPKVAEDLYGYHAVIIDDLEAEFFTPDQAMLLQKYVSERGASVLMLGGMESFRQGRYGRTAVGEMLPVYLDGRDEAVPPTAGGWQFQLTREGRLEPWVRLRENEQDEEWVRHNMPGFRVLNPVRDVKPGAGVLARVSHESGASYPALVTQRFGQGRTAALLVGDFWRWGMRDAAAHQELDKTWRQLLRWLVSDVPPQVEVVVEQAPGEPANTMTLKVRVRDAKFQPVDDATVACLVTPMLVGTNRLETNALSLAVEPVAREAGLYQAVFYPRAAGAYRVLALATNTVKAEIGRAEAGWATEFAADEFQSLLPNRKLLETLAKNTGGQVLRPEQLAKWVSQLPAHQAPVMEEWSFPLWHTPWMFILALGLLVAEWGIRRWKGLP